MGRRALSLLVVLVAVAGAPAARAELRAETGDWVLVAPDEVGTQTDLDLTARATQLCSDEIVKLLSHRPSVVPRFTMQWVPAAANGSGATRTGVFNWYTPGFRLLTPQTRAFRESLVAQRLCFGPHEVTHLLTWDSFRIAWANEGFAEYTDRLYGNASWRCCASPPPASFRCDESGYTRWNERTPFSDLSPFLRTNVDYNTAACFWWEVQRVGGFPALRAILASMRGEPPLTTGALVVRHVNPILGADLRPLLRRLGFEPAELEAPPRRLPPWLCTRIGMAGRDVLDGTRGRDVLCGLGGADLFRVRGGGADLVRCGPGRDAVLADQRDVVTRDCERVTRH
jgi:hypothetical protein